MRRPPSTSTTDKGLVDSCRDGLSGLMTLADGTEDPTLKAMLTRLGARAACTQLALIVVTTCREAVRTATCRTWRRADSVVVVVPPFRTSCQDSLTTFHYCGLSGHKINFTNSKTLVCVATDIDLPEACPNVNNFFF